MLTKLKPSERCTAPSCMHIQYTQTDNDKLNVVTSLALFCASLSVLIEFSRRVIEMSQLSVFVSGVCGIVLGEKFFFSGGGSTHTKTGIYDEKCLLNKQLTMYFVETCSIFNNFLFFYWVGQQTMVCVVYSLPFNWVKSSILYCLPTQNLMMLTSSQLTNSWLISNSHSPN